MHSTPTYESLLSRTRLRTSTVEDRSLATETDSDYGRVLFSTALRRLQQKTQVFPLEDNAAVRSRLTHSFEVAYFGRLIALKVIELANKQGLSEKWGLLGKEIAFRNTVETACMSHDIGNPPFGHFGEYAIQKWFGEKCIPILEKSIANLSPEDLAAFERTLLPDFTNFDGNAQGLRILTRLQWDRDPYGLNLTISQIAAFLKYMRSPHEPETEKPFQSKPGYFLSEKPIVDTVWRTLGLREGQRHPLAYIMEASDDIAYCVSDIEDALEKKLTEENEFKERLLAIWKKCAMDEGVDDPNYLNVHLEKAWEEPKGPHSRTSRFFRFKTNFTRDLTEKVSQLYVDHHDSIIQGSADSLLKLSSTHKAALEALKKYAKNHIFRTKEAEHLELAGFEVVTGLLEHLNPLLALPQNAFESLRTGKKVPNTAGKKSLRTDLERRLYNMLPAKHILVYEDTVNNRLAEYGNMSPAIIEWFARAHLLIDFVSGMTDRFALETYQLLSGIRT